MAETGYKLTFGDVAVNELGEFFDDEGQYRPLALVGVTGTIEPPMHADSVVDMVWANMPDRKGDAPLTMDKLDLGTEDDQERVSEFTYTQLTEVRDDAAARDRMTHIAEGLTAAFAEIPLED